MSKEILEVLEKRSNEIKSSISQNINNHNMLLGMAKEVKNLHSFLSKQLEQDNIVNIDKQEENK